MNQNLNSNLNNLDDNSPVKKQVSNSHLNEYNYDNMEGSHPSLNRKNYNESHIFDKPEVNSVPQGRKERNQRFNSFNNIFGSNELDPEAEKKAIENNNAYSRRHLKLTQQNRSDIFCLGGDPITHNQKLLASDVGQTQLPPEVPHVSRRTSHDNSSMSTTYDSMNNSISSVDRIQLANQPAFGLSSKQSHHSYTTKSRKFTPAQSSQILF